ncbi:MAG TPA: DnaJ domain-containing protein [Tepidiformaceae bacterium]|jgi:hypothetical protein
MASDWYEILQVSPKAEPEVIRAAYERLSEKHHPDVDSSPGAAERQQLLDQAFAILSDPVRRAEYDLTRAPSTGTAATAVSPGNPAAPVTAPARAVARIVPCPRDPEVETALRCSRCDTPICPRCLVQTPVGARCRDCARIVKSPVYTLDQMQIFRAAAASVIGGVAMGLIWRLVLVPFTVGFLSIFIGAGLGYVFTRIMELATGRKRGPVVAGLAVFGIAIAWGIQVVTLGLQFGLYGLVAAGVGVYFCYQNLR